MGNDYEHHREQQRRPVKQTEVTKALVKSDPPVLLDRPTSRTALQLRGSNKTPAQLITPDGLLPPSKDNVKTGLCLFFQVHGGLCATRVCLHLEARGLNHNAQHVKKLEFFPDLGHILNFQYSPLEAAAAPRVAEWEVSWQTSGGFGTGLDVFLPRLDSPTKSGLKFFSKMDIHKSNDSGSVYRISLVLKDTIGLEKYLSMLATSTISEIARTTWTPYVYTGPAHVDPRKCLNMRKTVCDASGGQLVRVPAQNSFATLQEAEIILSYGVWLEYRKAPFHGLRGSWPTPNPDQMPDLWVTKQLRGIRTLFNSGKTTLTQYQNTFLNQNAASRPLSNLLPLPISMLTVVLAMFPWTSDQRDAFIDVCSLHGNLGLVEGAPGSGRTTLLAGIGVWLVLEGMAVVLTAPCTASCRVLGDVVKQMISLLPSASHVSRINVVIHGDEAASRISPLSNTNLLVTTPNVVCSEEYCQNFGSTADSIMILQDDANLMMESETIAVAFCPHNCDKVAGIVLAMDSYEWKPSIVSEADGTEKCINRFHKHTEYRYAWFWDYYEATRKDNRAKVLEYRQAVREREQREKRLRNNCLMEFDGGMNEFANQLALSLPIRLRRQHFPTTKLTAQHRLRSEIAELSRERIYRSRLTSSNTTSTADDVRLFQELLSKWLGNGGPNYTRTVFVQVPNATCIKSRGTTDSKHNHEYVRAVYDLLYRNWKTDTLSKDKIKVIVPYKDQARLYQRFIKGNAHRGFPKLSDLPEILTLDQMRGRQAEVTIYDLTVTCGDNKHAIGIVGDEHRTNIALTRASEVSIVVGSSALVTVFPGFWSFLCKQKGLQNEPLPYIVQFAERMKERGLAYEAPKSSCGARLVRFEIEESWHKKFDGFYGWETARDSIADQGDRDPGAGPSRDWGMA